MIDDSQMMKTKSVSMRTIFLGLASFLAVIALIFLAVWLIYNRSDSSRLKEMSEFDMASPQGRSPSSTTVREYDDGPTGSNIDDRASVKTSSNDEQYMTRQNTELADTEPSLTFDMARVEPNGNAVIVGRGTPGSKIFLQTNSMIKLGEAVADTRGDWTIILDQPLPKGSSTIHLMEINKNGVTTKAEQKLDVVIGDQSDQPLVVVQEPQGSRALQRSENLASAGIPDEELQIAESNVVIVEERDVEEAASLLLSGDSSSPELSMMNSAKNIQMSKESDESAIIVRKGDNLWKLAKSRYGDGERYHRIYQLNRDQIRDPDLIFPGQIFQITMPDKSEQDVVKPR